MRRTGNLVAELDWATIFIYMGLVFFGWLNIYAAVYNPDTTHSFFELNHGKQLIWIGMLIIPASIILLLDYKFYEYFAYVIYCVVLVILVLVFPFGVEVAGAKSWFAIGPLKIQPGEFAKFATALAVARYVSQNSLDKFFNLIVAGAILLIPGILILLQNETGTFLVFTAFVIVFYREGMYPLLLIVAFLIFTLFMASLFIDKVWIISFLGTISFGAVVVIIINRYSKKISKIILISAMFALLSGLVWGVDFFVNEVLQPHQTNRIKTLIDPNVDPTGAGWQVIQSKIAIGSGGFSGKGFLNGTQTKFDFVPDQSTDMIFCTVGEEHGWIGSFIVIALFIALFLRLIFLAERQKTSFSRIYGYSVASIIFVHFMVNIGMTIGLFPIIGIPLPFFSYGGSSLLSFTILLFIFLNLDSSRSQIL